MVYDDWAVKLSIFSLRLVRGRCSNSLFTEGRSWGL